MRHTVKVSSFLRKDWLVFLFQETHFFLVPPVSLAQLCNVVAHPVGSTSPKVKKIREHSHDRPESLAYTVLDNKHSWLICEMGKRKNTLSNAFESETNT